MGKYMLRANYTQAGVGRVDEGGGQRAHKGVGAGG